MTRVSGNYYHATAHPWRPRPENFSAERRDVAVIGGGFTGLSAALACAERGLSVNLYEAEHIGFGASGRNGGQLIPGLRWSASRLINELGEQRGSALFDLCWRQNRVAARIAKHQIHCDLSSGFVEAAWTDAHLRDMNKEAEFLSKFFNYTLDLLDRSALGDHVQTPLYSGGLRDSAGGHFHPLNYALGLARAAEATGVQIFERQPAHPDQLTERHIIVATDSWIGDALPKLRPYSIPIMSYNVATAPLADPLAFLPSNAAIADSRFVLNYYRLSADNRLIFGGGERYRSTPPKDIAAFVRPYLSRVFPALADIPIDYAWGGAVDVTLNRLPHIGRTGKDGNIFYAHGFSGHGAMVTTLVGDILAEAVCGTLEGYDCFASLPHRPFPGGALLSRPLAVLGLFYYALRDRLG